MPTSYSHAFGLSYTWYAMCVVQLKWQLLGHFVTIYIIFWTSVFISSKRQNK